MVLDKEYGCWVCCTKLLPICRSKRENKSPNFKLRSLKQKEKIKHAWQVVRQRQNVKERESNHRMPNE